MSNADDDEIRRRAIDMALGLATMRASGGAVSGMPDLSRVLGPFNFSGGGDSDKGGGSDQSSGSIGGFWSLGNVGGAMGLPGMGGAGQKILDLISGRSGQTSTGTNQISGAMDKDKTKDDDSVDASSALPSRPWEWGATDSPFLWNAPRAGGDPNRAIGGTVEPEAKHHSHFQPRSENGMFAGPPKSPAPVTQAAFAKGGAISNAVKLARRYADGGAVLAGPVVGETGGRTDALPVDVEAGSFVIPADCVAALGEGNTLAGTKVLDEKFGASRPRMAAGGQPVPIKISDGEYVVAPEMVRRIGGGDMDRGHQMLDEFVKGTRAKHISTLQRLAPPAR